MVLTAISQQGNDITDTTRLNKAKFYLERATAYFSILQEQYDSTNNRLAKELNALAYLCEDNANSQSCSRAIP